MYSNALISEHEQPFFAPPISPLEFTEYILFPLLVTLHVHFSLLQDSINKDIKELHSRISTNNRELISLMSEQHKEQTDKMTKLEIELHGRVGVLEKWRWIIIGGSIVAGFIIQKILVIQ